MLLDPERIFGWDAFTYILMAAVAVLAFVLVFRTKRERAARRALAVLLVLIVLSEIALSLSLGGTGLFFLEWIAYFGELLLFLPGFVGCLMGVLIRFFTARKERAANEKP